MKKAGFTSFNIGPEPEFFLFKMDENGEPTLHLNDKGSYFDMAPMDLGENCRREIVLTLEEMGFDVEAAHHEVAPGQHEIDFKYADAWQLPITFKHSSWLLRPLLVNTVCTQPSCQSLLAVSTVQECI